MLEHGSLSFPVRLVIEWQIPQVHGWPTERVGTQVLMKGVSGLVAWMAAKECQMGDLDARLRRATLRSSHTPRGRFRHVEAQHPQGIRVTTDNGERSVWIAQGWQSCRKLSAVCFGSA